MHLSPAFEYIALALAAFAAGVINSVAGGGGFLVFPSLLRIGGSLALMAATTAVVIWICGRAFRAGALSTGRVDLKGLALKLMGRGV